MADAAYQALRIVLLRYAPSVKERLVIDCSGYGFDDLRSRSIQGLSELKRAIRERNAMYDEDFFEQERFNYDPPSPGCCDPSVGYHVLGLRWSQLRARIWRLWLVARPHRTVSPGENAPAFRSTERGKEAREHPPSRSGAGRFAANSPRAMELII